MERITIPAGVKTMGVSVFEDCDSLKAINLLTSSDFALPSYTFPVDLRELYLPFDLPADYDVEFTAQSVYVPLGCKAGYVANIQKNNPDYTGENVKELDFDARSFAINAAEGYGTYYTDRPFVMPEGVEGGVVTPGDAEGVMRVDYRYAAGDVVPAGVGLVLKGEPGTYAYESKFFYEAPAAPTENLLSGTVQQTVLPEDESVAYYMLSYDREGADLGFYWGAEDGGPFTNGAHRAYLALPRGEAALAKAFVLDGAAGRRAGRRLYPLGHEGDDARRPAAPRPVHHQRQEGVRPGEIRVTDPFAATAGAKNVGARREARPAHTMRHEFAVRADETGSAGVPLARPYVAPPIDNLQCNRV